ncbi:hypothetical protein KYJ26_16860 [Bacillus sp. MCCB 382]|nr:hypothetical protein [Bacillus sp. MCCB 382]
MKRSIFGMGFGVASGLMLLFISGDYADVFIGTMVGYLYGADGVGDRE